MQDWRVLFVPSHVERLLKVAFIHVETDAPSATGNISVNKNVEGHYFVDTTVNSLVTMEQNVRLALKSVLLSVPIQNVARTAEIPVLHVLKSAFGNANIVSDATLFAVLLAPGFHATSAVRRSFVVDTNALLFVANRALVKSTVWNAGAMMSRLQ
mmetsp:Transcript_4607/g.10913  ORF Transcript_4607/g.10913 Transcript_4607/m.10913 type:complete len:155 (-) Transcript_4607:1469-1933(-)